MAAHTVPLFRTKVLALQATGTNRRKVVFAGPPAAPAIQVSIRPVTYPIDMEVLATDEVDNSAAGSDIFTLAANAVSVVKIPPTGALYLSGTNNATFQIYATSEGG